MTALKGANDASGVAADGSVMGDVLGALGVVVGDAVMCSSSVVGVAVAVASLSQPTCREETWKVRVQAIDGRGP